jgi:3D (Asp-Asp-Asp) domain-containing protein
MQIFMLATIFFMSGCNEYETRTMKVTAYCPCTKCCGKYGWGYTTASGYKIKPGDRFVAADKSLPFGTEVQIPGYGNVQVKDRGGAIKGNRLDVYFDTHREALKWGVKTLQVKIRKGTL